MNTRNIGGIALCITVATARLAFAQTPSPPGVFVDGAMMADRDPTDFFYGSNAGIAGRGAIGVHLSPRHSLRFEVDVPHWRVMDTTSSSPVWCAAGAGCIGGVGPVPARIASRSAVRTVSYAFLYAYHLPEMGRVQVALLAGGSIEERSHRSSSSFDELDRDGVVVRHNSYGDAGSRGWPAAVFGVDGEVRLTSHFAVTPQFRFHTFPYPAISIARPGIALRWRF